MAKKKLMPETGQIILISHARGSKDTPDTWESVTAVLAIDDEYLIVEQENGTQKTIHIDQIAMRI